MRQRAVLVALMAVSGLLAGCFLDNGRPKFDPDLKTRGEFVCRNHGGLLTIDHIYLDQYGEKVIFTCKEGMTYENMINYPNSNPDMQVVQ